MKSNKFNRIIAVMLTTVMTSILITPTLAFAKYEGKDKKTASKKNSPDVRAAVLESIRTQDGRTEFSPEELEQMRSALLELLDSVQEFAALMSPEARSKAGMKDFGEPLTADQSDEVRTQIQNMSGQELTTLRKALNPAKMRTKIAASRTALNEYKDSVSEGTSEGGNRPGLPGITSYCGAPVSSSAIIAADAIYFIAEGVRDIAQNVCNQVVLGANLRSGCNITDAVYLAAKGVNQGIHFCDDDYAASVGEANYDRLGHIHDDIEDIKANDNINTTTITGAVTAAKTAIISNDNTNTTNIISNDNANKTAIITNDNANTVTITNAVEAAKTQVIVNANANKDELLRLQIHADLATVDSATPVAIFVLPATKNGYLELVRTIVVQMITDLAGSKTAEANAFLAQGDAHKNTGNFKSAYSSYRRAYQTAAR